MRAFAAAAAVITASVTFAVIMMVVHTMKIGADFQSSGKIGFRHSSYIAGCSAHNFDIGGA